jgi:prepilin signal peptidase PulO-like enzyme (type II secretory pathway)
MSDPTHILYTAGGLLFSVVVGMMLGSCSTLAVYRLPRGKPWIGKPTRCLHCDHRLYLLDYLPIFSLLITRGKCRYCKAPIECPWIYFWVELCTAVLVVATYWFIGFADERYVLVTGLSVAVVIIGAIDAEHRKIPANPLLALALLGVAYRVLLDGSVFGVIGGGATTAALALLLRYGYFARKGTPEIGRDFIGSEEKNHFGGPFFDYVKLALIVGVWLGAAHGAVAVLLAVTGSVVLYLMKPLWWSEAHPTMPLSLPLILALVGGVFYGG